MYIISIYKINLHLPRGEFFNKLNNLFRKQVYRVHKINRFYSGFFCLYSNGVSFLHTLF